MIMEEHRKERSGKVNPACHRKKTGNSRKPISFFSILKAMAFEKLGNTFCIIQFFFRYTYPLSESPLVSLLSLLVLLSRFLTQVFRIFEVYCLYAMRIELMVLFSHDGIHISHSQCILFIAEN